MVFLLPLQELNNIILPLIGPSWYTTNNSQYIHLVLLPLHFTNPSHYCHQCHCPYHLRQLPHHPLLSLTPPYLLSLPSFITVIAMVDRYTYDY